MNILKKWLRKRHYLTSNLEKTSWHVLMSATLVRYVDCSSPQVKKGTRIKIRYINFGPNRVRALWELWNPNSKTIKEREFQFFQFRASMEVFRAIRSTRAPPKNHPTIFGPFVDRHPSTTWLSWIKNCWESSIFSFRVTLDVFRAKNSHPPRKCFIKFWAYSRSEFHYEINPRLITVGVNFLI